MAFTRINLNPPIDAGVTCRHCGQQLVAIALLDDGLYRSCDWRHAAGLKVTCRPVQTAAPRDAGTALALVEAGRHLERPAASSRSTRGVRRGERATEVQNTRTHRGAGMSEQAAEVNWRAIAEQRDRELRVLGERKYRVEQERDALRAEVNLLRTRLANVKQAKSRLFARIIANAHLLDTPFRNQPDLSPLDLLKRDMRALNAALRGSAEERSDDTKASDLGVDK